MAEEQRIFISHVEEDAPLALALADRLEKRGYPTWYYERDTLPGISYLEQTGKAVESCQAFILMISKDSLGSHQIDLELERAHEESKTIIPIRHGVSHPEFQARRPLWRQIIGTRTSIEVDMNTVDLAANRISEALKRLQAPAGGSYSPKKSMETAKKEDVVTNEAPLVPPVRVAMDPIIVEIPVIEVPPIPQVSIPEVTQPVEKPKAETRTLAPSKMVEVPLPKFCRGCGRPFLEGEMRCAKCGRERRPVESGRHVVKEHLGLVAYDEGYVVDPQLRLLWQRAGDDVARDYQEAQTYCRELRLGGFSDWRLPTKEELMHLARFGYANLQQVFPTVHKSNYWALAPPSDRTTGQGGGDLAHIINLDPESKSFGGSVLLNKKDKYCLKAVRNYR